MHEHFSILFIIPLRGWLGFSILCAYGRTRLFDNSDEMQVVNGLRPYDCEFYVVGLKSCGTISTSHDSLGTGMQSLMNSFEVSINC